MDVARDPLGTDTVGRAVVRRRDPCRGDVDRKDLGDLALTQRGAKQERMRPADRLPGFGMLNAKVKQPRTLAFGREARL